jgi:hypothetical protein
MGVDLSNAGCVIITEANAIAENNLKQPGCCGAARLLEANQLWR